MFKTSGKLLFEVNHIINKSLLVGSESGLCTFGLKRGGGIFFVTLFVLKAMFPYLFTSEF